MTKLLNKSFSIRHIVFIISISIALVFVFFLSLCIGSIHIPLGEVIAILLGKDAQMSYEIIIYRIRFPRAFMAALLGGALSLSGFLLQIYFQNPIAGPFVLGISSGARLGIAIVLVFVSRLSYKTSSVIFILASFFGSLLVTAFILLVSKKVRHIASLLVSGIMAGYITSAATDFIIALSDDSNIVNMHAWLQGSFSGMSQRDCLVASIIVFPAFILTMCMAKQIDAWRLGEAYASSMGVNISIMRPLLILLSSILSATVSAFAGPISFLGISVPFLVKHSIKSTKPQILIPTVFLSGALLCLVCDLLARTVISPSEMSISIITSLIGSPIVIFLLLRQNKW